MKLAIKFGITETGFIAPTFEEILDSVQQDMKLRFGDDISLSTNSQFGIFSYLIAWREMLLIQELQKTYYSAFISTATNSALDRIGANLEIERKIETQARAIVRIETDGEYLLQAGEQFQTEDGIVFDLIKDTISTQDPTTGKWIAIGELLSEDYGEDNNVSANSITLISNADDMILSVTNPEPAAGGQDTETDEEYRIRLLYENANRPGPTAPGIKSALLNLPGVRQVSIIQNPDGVVDKYGNSPYSVHVYLLGGEKEDIATCLANTTAAGITLVGSQEATVVNATGDKQKINFDYAKEEPVFVKVEIKVNSQWNKDTGANTVKTAITESINELEMGNPVYLTKLYPAVYGIEGIEEARITIGVSKDNLKDEDIETAMFSVPTCEEPNVEVYVNEV